LEYWILIQGEIGKSYKANSNKGALAGHARGKKPNLQISLSVTTCDKQWKVFLENVGIWAGEASNI